MLFRSAFGVAEEELERAIRHGIIPFSPHIERIRDDGRFFAKQIASGKQELFSVLLYGPNSAGKTALAADIALNSQFPFIKMVTAKNMIGMGEQSKIDYIRRAFNDAWKSRQSIIIMDEIETMIEYTPVGPRFQSGVLSAIGLLMRTVPPKVGPHHTPVHIIIPQGATTY